MSYTGIAALQKQRIAVLLWLLTAFWTCRDACPSWIAAIWPPPDRITDFYQDWGSARNHIVGLPIYTHHAISVPRHLGIPADDRSEIKYNAHPPPAVLLVLPLAQVNYSHAISIWNVISLVAFATSLAIVAIELDLPRTVLLPILALIPLCHPIYGNVYLGQLTLFLVLLVTMVWVFERTGRSNIAGLLIGVAAAIKLFPAFLVLYYLARGRWQSLSAAALSFVGLTVIAVFVLGLDCYCDYISVVIPGQAKFWSCGYNLSIAGLWHKLFNPVIEQGLINPLWFNPTLARSGTLISDLVITLVVARCAFQAQTQRQCELAFAQAITAMLLVAPVSWDFSLPLLLVPIALLMYDARPPVPRWMHLVLILILAIFWIPQNLITNLALAGRPASHLSWAFMLGVPSLKFYGLLGIFTLILLAFRGARAVESTALVTDQGKLLPQAGLG
jgi:hypothetical protein